MLQLQSDSQDNQANKPPKESKWKIYLTLAMFILVELPKIGLSWIELAEKMRFLQIQYTQTVEKVLESSGK